MLSSCSLVGSVTVVGVDGSAVVVAVILLLFVIRAGNWGAGARFTILPSFSIFKWSRGGGTGLPGVVEFVCWIGVDGVVVVAIAVPFTPLYKKKYEQIYKYFSQIRKS